MKFKAICVLKVKMNFCFHFDDESSPLSLAMSIWILFIGAVKVDDLFESSCLHICNFDV